MTVHPYVPTALELPGYVAPEHSALALCLVMGVAVSVVTGAAYAVLRQRVRGGELAAGVWFAVSGSMHSTFELYYVAYARTLAARRDIVSSLWKEYAKSDSRYIAGAAVVRVQEAATVAVVGPLCWLALWGIWTRRGWARDIGQLAASVLHMQGVLLYYGAELVGEPGCRPEAQYFYGYFVAANAAWLVVPLWLAGSSMARMAAQMRQMQS
ncbi:hypothetical protein LPJ78_002404 [Coemansia sp. RSA 989]|nr:Emopamil-binding protein [Coemansia mojavensis]KAJ1742403.1 hypothetical protein LPJ68_001912 [Coemansia sp. RSA 1086]KAJ1752765.1 hypothetical protein LPJ79_000901 [Coemansia sp. RSA 1821]KAJ1865811.1 hypothetical protein LPJ78_002404 [Coemansia sp. RSA 989]KAJ1875177.1 hypothetical protein LPJ55_000849 [Coemansia sp. RSA 990]KAJ2627907.1 hypothetical protein H4R22_004165 [Coemansia sp. RSA 1290]KAJ2650575.1 hypothetical protein IWW40_002312 [Coemansia sp. RSA 1250]KAJ2671856.1 hypotheti